MPRRFPASRSTPSTPATPQPTSTAGPAPRPPRRAPRSSSGWPRSARTAPPAGTSTPGDPWPGSAVGRPGGGDGGSGGGDGRQAGLGYLHVLAVMAAADADTADHGAADGNRVPAAEHDQPIDPGGRAHGEGRVVLDELVPRVGGHPEADRRVGLVLGHLNGKQ